MQWYVITVLHSLMQNDRDYTNQSERTLYDQNDYTTNQTARYMIKITTLPIRARVIWSKWLHTQSDRALYDKNYYTTNKSARYMIKIA